MGYHLRAEAAAGPRAEGGATRGACTPRAGVGSGYRYYSPGLGRWLNRDPIGEQGGWNVYVAMRNSLLTGYDYLGLTPSQLIPCPCDETEIDAHAYALTVEARVRSQTRPVFVAGTRFEAEYCGLVCCERNTGRVFTMGPFRGHWIEELGGNEIRYNTRPPGRPTCGKVFEQVDCGDDLIVRKVHNHPFERGEMPEFSNGQDGDLAYCRRTGIPLTVVHTGEREPVFLTCGRRLYRLTPDGRREFVRNL